jgi:hypothetical protein
MLSTEARGFGASRFPAYSAVPSSTRACGAVWHRRSPSGLLRGATFREVVIQEEVPGFFALAAEVPILRAA